MSEKVPYILVVDDDEFPRDYLSMMIEKKTRYSSKVVKDGQYALDFLEERFNNGGRMPSLVISDIQMPRINGLELVRICIQGDGDALPPLYPGLPFLMMSGALQEYQGELDSMNIPYMNKPFPKIEELVAKIKETIND